MGFLEKDLQRDQDEKRRDPEKGKEMVRINSKQEKTGSRGREDGSGKEAGRGDPHRK